MKKFKEEGLNNKLNKERIKDMVTLPLRFVGKAEREIHTKMKKYCNKKEITMETFVIALIEKELEGKK